MIRRILSISIIAIILCVGIGNSNADTSTNQPTRHITSPDTIAVDSVVTDSVVVQQIDSIVNDSTRYTTLTEADYQKVAEELGVEVAAMKAVVVIEAGSSLEGFLAPGVPLVNFDSSVYNKIGNKGTSGKKAAANATIPDGIKSSYGKKEWQQLINARKTNEDRANMATFWGMFQIGGFNYKLCGCESIDEFVNRMSYSELEQLELFAAFITNTGIVKYLQDKNWAAFARKYNGPSYAKRGYHTKMAKAYKKFKNQNNITFNHENHRSQANIDLAMF